MNFSHTNKLQIQADVDEILGVTEINDIETLAERLDGKEISSRLQFHRDPSYGIDANQKR
jgi:hypothetical protein